MYPFGDRALIAVIHLPALPGSPGAQRSLDAIVEQAVLDARCLADAGFDGLIVENFGDVPFRAERVEPHTVAAMARVTAGIAHAVAVPVGVNVLRNDARAAIAIAATTGARFVRVNVHVGAAVTDQGIVQGQAAETVRYRDALRAEVAILADVHVKHASPLGETDIRRAAEETAYRGLADALIVTGPSTGRMPDLSEVKQVKSAVPDRPVLAGSGVTAETVDAVLAVADGVIVGTSLKAGGRMGEAFDPTRVTAFVRSAGR